MPDVAAAACPDSFPAAFRTSLAEQFAGQRVTASVYDTRSGCWSHLHHGMQIETASTIKAQFLAGVLLRAQDEGRPVTAWERMRITPMISLSHNPPASELFISLGGTAGQERLDDRFGLGATTSTSRWGATSTTAHDRTLLALRLLHSGGPLAAAGRAEAWAAMTAVHPSQQWGITAGVPSGWTVALKNGFYPTTGTPRWRIGSTGFVREDHSGHGYAVTILTDRNPDHATGQGIVEQVSRQIAGTLTTGAPAARPLDRSVCVATRSGESWPAVAARLGTDDVTNVRSVSGNPTSPLSGMRACRPDLAPAYDPASPNAHYVRATFQTFLGRLPSDEESQQRWIPLTIGQTSRLDLTRALSRSDEWLRRTIDQQYRSIFDRPVDSSGAATWTRAVRSGSTMTQISAQLLASPEFYARAGGTPGAFVADLYRRVLGRAASTTEVDHWVDRLATGTSRHAVASGFHSSLESRRLRVHAVYRMVLDRPADSTGLVHWSERLVRDDDVALASILATSAEYFDRSQHG